MKSNKSLAALLANITVLDPESDCAIHGISIDSRLVKPGDLFIAYPGEQADGRNFIPQALKAGAVAILAEENHYTWPLLPAGIILVKAKDVKHKMGLIAARFYDNPSRHMNVTGVTGTNGKTSIAYLLSCAFNILEKATTASAYLGTLGTGFPDAIEESNNTTLEAIYLQAELAEFHKKRVAYVSIEVSSHALDQGRTAHVEFDTAVFTNLTQDHLDYHKTMEAYGKAKAKLFEQFGLKSAVINWDDPFGLTLYQTTSSSIFRLSYSLRHPEADIYADEIKILSHGMQARLRTPWGDGILKTRLIGHFNLSNLLAVVAVLGLYFPLEKVLDCIAQLPSVPGRLECISSSKVLFIVDYAHTPDALENVLKTTREWAKTRQGKLWCIFGCGGDRDKGKRPQMGAIAEKLSDKIIITNDNPRTENPENIAKEILSGFKKPQNATVILDREKAIIHTFEQAEKNDIILIAGKGHEPYQIIGKEKYPFSDKAICRALASVNFA